MRYAKKKNQTIARRLSLRAQRYNKRREIDKQLADPDPEDYLATPEDPCDEFEFWVDFEI